MVSHINKQQQRCVIWVLEGQHRRIRLWYNRFGNIVFLSYRLLHNCKLGQIMRIFDVQKNMQKMNPGKTVTVDLDDNSICAFELMADGGNPNLFGHVCFDRAKVSIEGMDPVYLEIEHHRQPVPIAELRRKFAAMTDVVLPADVLMNIQEMNRLVAMSEKDKAKLDDKEKLEADSARVNLAEFRKDLKSSSGLDDAAIDAKVEAYIQ